MYRAPFRFRSNRHPTHIFPKQLTAAQGFLRCVEEKLPTISAIPALILWGDKDFAFKENERNRFRSTFYDSRVVTLKNAGHFIQEDAPEEICHAILEWYRERD